jgi:glucose-1-phosphate thymidylyltransferase
MLGIVLAGGLGTRLYPLTRVTNKSLLPVYNKPMIFHPIQTLVDSGISDILLVCGGNSAGMFLKILGNGEDFGLARLNYAYQSEPKGIAHALKQARDWAEHESIAVILADNVFEDNFTESIRDFENSRAACKIFVKEVKRPEWYGVVELGNKKTSHTYSVQSIEEKPEQPKAKTVATGLYMYKPTIWQHIDALKLSGRGELEITDLNNIFLYENSLVAEKVPGYWGDAGESIDVYNEVCHQLALKYKSKHDR